MVSFVRLGYLLYQRVGLLVRQCSDKKSSYVTVGCGNSRMSSKNPVSSSLDSNIELTQNVMIDISEYLSKMNILNVVHKMSNLSIKMPVS